MSNEFVGEVWTDGTGYETHGLIGHDPEDVDSATSSLNTPITSKEEARQIKAATDLLTKNKSDTVNE